MAERPAGRPPVNSNTSVPGRQHSKCCHVLGLQPFLALGYVELDLLPFHQSAVPFATNGAEVHEHIRTRLTLNEAKALGIVEPFNRTGLPIRHYHLPTSQMIFHRPESRCGDSDTPCNVHWIPGAKPDAALRPAWGALPASRSYAPPGIMFIEAVLRF